MPNPKKEFLRQLDNHTYARERALGMSIAPIALEYSNYSRAGGPVEGEVARDVIKTAKQVEKYLPRKLSFKTNKKNPYGG